ncbi:MAG: hypothetical protein ACFNYB_02575 [Campylobacter sp.]
MTGKIKSVGVNLSDTRAKIYEPVKFKDLKFELTPNFGVNLD